MTVTNRYKWFCHLQLPNKCKTNMDKLGQASLEVAGTALL